ncbi:fimbrial protein [Erwinia piriflorinigrans]|uniref:Putative adhesin MrkD n=1 Tax=Erwinia piriflorinigrans CFBP 5888 TaxID=1161919 RepID=V5Z4V2_9GAMM|nr:fimbrial protein [Erwinia piriflorinigrans]CCG86019.1 putative adhesin MrkD [Erwinia piriflorinigrans CFBP 5888]
MRKFSVMSVVIALLMLSATVQATCTRTSAGQVGDTATAIIPFGKINLSDNYLQPPGTLLSSVVIPPTSYNYAGANASSVLFECDRADLSSIYFLVATNGDDRVGGFYDIGGPDGLQDVYATWFSYTGLKLTMAGNTVTRYWKKIPIGTYATTSNGKIQIRLQDIPPMQAELYKISSLPASAAASMFCGSGNGGLGFAGSTGTNYTCNQPNAYIQLSGESNVSFSFGRDKPGEDSAYRFNFWFASNGIGYGMRASNSLFQTSSCVARNVTPVVILPGISAARLQSGESTSADFSVQIECSNAASSGVNSMQTAIGFQVSYGAWSAAQRLGLVNSSGGVSYLVSDNYYASDMAKGVGIALRNSQGTNMNFVGQAGTLSMTTPGGNAAGWYPVLNGSNAIGNNATGYTTYNQSMTARLVKLPGADVTPGKVYATAYVVVKMQ